MDKFYEAKLERVKNDGNQLRFMKKANRELCEIAIKNTFSAIQWIPVKEQTEDIDWFCLNLGVEAIEFIKNPTYEMCKFVIGEDPVLLDYIPHKYLEGMWDLIRQKKDKNPPYVLRTPETFVLDAGVSHTYNGDTRKYS